MNLAKQLREYSTQLILQRKYKEHSAYSEEIKQMKDKLKEKYGEDVFFSCRLYHFLIKSTMPPGTKEIFDLPNGEWSEFIEKKAKEFGIN